jgi:cobalt/nickel transport system ATP-binding protein
MNLEPIIEVFQLSYQYPDGRTALSEINLKVFPGEKLALVGANGAGKSTLLMHLNGIFSGKGKIRVDGMELNKSNLGKIRALVGVVFQNPDDQLFSPTVFEDVAYGPIYQGLDKTYVKARVDEALNEVHMIEYADRNPYHLSGGEKKRIAIATVLSMQPKILLFDEPTAGLDPRARRESIELLETLPQTMLIATHDLEMTRQLTTRMVILKHGHIVQDAPTGQVLAQPDLLFANDLA